MALTPGTRLGPYEVTAALGAGGMGEVYRATDTKLKREVAIKILPPSVAGDHDRLARFQREAEVLASLNHPNIAAIYGLEESGPSTGSGQAGITALVMELVEGRDLSEIIAEVAAPRGGGAAVTPEAERVGARSRAHEGSGTPRGEVAPRLAVFAEASTAGNAAATPAAIAAAATAAGSPNAAAFQSIVGTATAKISIAVITTALLCPVAVMLADHWQRARGIDGRAESTES